MSSTKIAVIGQPNVGKTSILNVLKQDYESTIAISPTKGVERNFMNVLGQELVIWDFGGQEKYQEKYLQDPEKYFDNIKYLYFVVDARNLDNIQHDLEYFKKIYSFAGKYNQSMKISIIFNKIDPELDFKSVLINRCATIFDSFAELVDQSKHYLTVFYTSIYEPMSIIVGFSEILVEARLRETVKRKLEEVVIDENPYYQSVLIDNFLELAHVEFGAGSKKELSEEIMEEIIKVKSNFIKNAWISLKSAADKGIMIEDHFIRVFPIKMAKTEYLYLFGIKNPDDTQKQKLNALLPKIGEEISQLIRGFS